MRPGLIVEIEAVEIPQIPPEVIGEVEGAHVSEKNVAQAAIGPRLRLLLAFPSGHGSDPTPPPIRFLHLPLPADIDSAASTDYTEEDMKILLFDIDGTLLMSGGGARKAFTRALSEAAGRPIRVDGYSFSGRTDPQIARDILSANGVEGETLDTGIPETIRLYLRYFAEIIPRLETARLLPGVRELLSALDGRDGVRTALLTGNVEGGARLKLERFGLTRFFDFSLSCFGSDDADRYRLPDLALSRARGEVGSGVMGRDLVIVGDSEHDVLCARVVGARSVAVGTGWTPTQTLRALEPHALLEDFSDTRRTLEALLED